MTAISNNLFTQPATLPEPMDEAPIVVANADPLAHLKYTLLSPERIVLQEEASIQGIGFVAGTELAFKGGRIVEIGSPIDLCINGVWWARQILRKVKQGSRSEYQLLKLKLYPSGQVKQGLLLKDAEIGGILCRGDKLTSLHENGHLKRGYPKRNVTIEGIEYLSWSEEGDSHPIELYKNGKVAKGTLVDETLIDGLLCSCDLPIELHPNGKLKACRLQMSIYINEIEYKQGADLEFYEYGGLKKRPLQSPETIDGIECAAGFIELYPNQKLKSGSFTKPTEIDQILYTGPFTLDENGKIISGQPVEDLTIVLSFGASTPICRSGNAIFKWKYPIFPLHQTHLYTRIGIKVAKEHPFNKTEPQKFSFQLAEDLSLFGFALHSGDQVTIDCAHQQCTVLLSQEIQTFQNHSFPPQTSITFNWDGQLLSARSPYPIWIQKIGCESDTPILFYPSGDLFQATIVDFYRDLAPESLIQLTPKGKLQAAYLSERDFEHFSCPRQTWLLFDDRERLIRFSPDDNSSATLSWKEDGSLETFAVRGQNNLIAEDINVSIPHDITLQNIHCKRGWFCFSSYGQLQEAALAPETLREFGFENLSLEIGGDFADEILFDVPEETRIQGIPCTGIVSFYPSKRIKTVTLAKDWVVASHLFLKNTQMTFSDQDPRTILSFMPPEPYSSAGIISKNQTVIHLHFNGALKQITLGVPFDIWAQDTDLHFRENGMISQGTLGIDIAGLKKGTQVEWIGGGGIRPLNPLKRFSVDDFFATDDEPATKKRG